MRYLGFIPLLCAGVVVFCVTTFGMGEEPRALAAGIRPELPDSSPPPTPSAERDPNVALRIATEREARASRRAFYTAPPVIPHELFPASAGDCLTCHEKEGQYFGKFSPVTPHPQLTNCTQCHLPGTPAFAEMEATPAETGWKGLEAPLEGTRAHVVAPPTMPHRTFLRESCLTCHSAQSPYLSLQCPHPERTSCTQCHVSAGENEFLLDAEKALPAY